MNLLDAYVKEVLSEPYQAYGRWWVKVKAECWGQYGEHEIMCDTIDEAKAIKVGHKFLT